MAAFATMVFTMPLSDGTQGNPVILRDQCCYGVRASTLLYQLAPAVATVVVGGCCRRDLPKLLAQAFEGQQRRVLLWGEGVYPIGASWHQLH